jgi:hypothetical protein
MATDNTLDNWLSSWPDVVAFVIGLAVARWAGWNAGDLVWSLWLSSLVVGYATIVWMIAQPAAEVVRVWWRDRAAYWNLQVILNFWLILPVAVAFVLGFFTIHFGFFHYIQSQILIGFFPIDPGDGGRVDDTRMSTYVEIVRRYWMFLPSAFLAHRAAFLRKPFSWDRDTAKSSVAGDNKFKDLFTEPYKNVMRMHVLIFFFSFAHFARLENFAVFTVVYAVYFFPWRLVRRPETTVPTISLSVRED